MGKTVAELKDELKKRNLYEDQQPCRCPSVSDWHHRAMSPGVKRQACVSCK